MKLRKIIIASILALMPVKAIAQDVLKNIPSWGQNRNNPSYAKIYSDTLYTHAVDRQYVRLNNGNYGVIVYAISNYGPSRRFSRTYYEFNCQTGAYIFKGEIYGNFENGQVKDIYWIGPCTTEVCQVYSKITNQYIHSGIKKYCPR